MKTYNQFLYEASRTFIQEAQLDPKVTALMSKYKKYKSDDYQKRGDRAPRSGIPDTIEVGGWQNEFFMTFTFKNTSQKTAEAWVKKLLGSEAKKFKIGSRQEGDYKDDWVAVEAGINV